MPRPHHVMLTKIFDNSYLQSPTTRDSPFSRRLRFSWSPTIHHRPAQANTPLPSQRGRKKCLTCSECSECSLASPMPSCLKGSPPHEIHGPDAASALLTSLRRQRNANQLLVIPSEHALLGEGRMAPDDIPTHGLVGRFEDVDAVQFLITLGRKLGQDQVA